MYSPAALARAIDELKELLDDPNAPFGVDLLLPQIGGSARKTNHGTCEVRFGESAPCHLILFLMQCLFEKNKDYTHGKLDELADVMIEKGTDACCKLFFWLQHNVDLPFSLLLGSPLLVSRRNKVICLRGGRTPEVLGRKNACRWNGGHEHGGRR
jgi:hypothetical protein